MYSQIFSGLLAVPATGNINGLRVDAIVITGHLAVAVIIIDRRTMIVRVIADMVAGSLRWIDNHFSAHLEVLGGRIAQLLSRGIGK